MRAYGARISITRERDGSGTSPARCIPGCVFWRTSRIKGHARKIVLPTRPSSILPGASSFALEPSRIRDYTYGGARGVLPSLGNVLLDCSATRQTAGFDFNFNFVLRFLLYARMVALPPLGGGEGEGRPL
jgi:hypothetical protein